MGARTMRIVAVAPLAVLLGAALPARAATTAELLRCQKGVHSRVASFVKFVETALSNCTYRVESCQLAQEIDGDDPTQCLASASSTCSSLSAKVPGAKSSYTGKALLMCSTVPLGDLEQYVGGLGFFGVSSVCSAGTVNDLLECIFDGAQCSAERTLFTLDPRAADALTAAGVAGAHPCVGP
jgi:hypothetical protein